MRKYKPLKHPLWNCLTYAEKQSVKALYWSDREGFCWDFMGAVEYYHHWKKTCENNGSPFKEYWL